MAEKRFAEVRLSLFSSVYVVGLNSKFHSRRLGQHECPTGQLQREEEPVSNLLESSTIRRVLDKFSLVHVDCIYIVLRIYHVNAMLNPNSNNGWFITTNSKSQGSKKSNRVIHCPMQTSTSTHLKRVST